MPDKQGSDELRIFRLFAAAAKLEIPEESIHKRQPPEPDIFCELPDLGPTGFELVEVIDPGLAQSVAAQVRLQEALRQRATSALTDFGNALVFVQYVRNTLVQQRVKNVTNLIDYLRTLPPGFEGDQVVPRDSELASVVRALRVTRGRFVGPIFQVEGGAWISDPIIECVRRKFAKRYAVAHRLELLVFYELQFTPMATTKMPELEAYVENHLRESQFARVWVFDAENRSVLCSCDGPSLEQGHAV
jgi:hypothetical protein